MKRLSLSIGLLLIAISVQAAETNQVRNPFTPLQISLWNPVQLAPEKWDVLGLRLNLLYGKNVAVKGIDIGLVNSARRFEGIQIGLFNTVSGMSMMPFSFPTYPTSTGIQIGSINYVLGNFDGIQIGGNVNSVFRRVRGIQLAVINQAGDMRGLQIGLINNARTMVGVQIGAINTITESPVPFFPIINAHF